MAQIKNNILYTGLSLILLSSVAFANNYSDTNTARMQAMDKITGRVNEIDIPINSEVNFGSFSIVVRRCVSSSPEETPENIAFVDIADTYNTQTPTNIFKGWMLSSSPALNAVEHPIYDIWLLKCINKNATNTKLLSSEELLQRDNLPSTQIVLQTSDNSSQTTASTNEFTEETDTKLTKQPDELTDKNELVDKKEVVSIVVTQPEKNEDTLPKDLLSIEGTDLLPSSSKENDTSISNDNSFTDEENGFEE